MASNNQIGNRGESIFQTRITEGYRFNIYFLGEKAECIDYMLEIVDPPNFYPFYVQVKGTEQGYDTNGRVKAKIQPKKLKGLAQRVVPTYVAAVDVNQEKVYVCPAFLGTEKYTSSMPVKHVLEHRNPDSVTTLEWLVKDVTRFWQKTNTFNIKKNYISLL